MNAALAAVALMVWLAFSWLIVSWSGLKPPSSTILMAVLAIAGLLLAGLASWLIGRRALVGGKGKKSSSDGHQGPPVPTRDDTLPALLTEAEGKLTNGRTSAGARFATSPVVFLLGGEGSAKTTAVVRSGIEPDLLAGHVFRDGEIEPTALANLWYARKHVFVEAGANVQADPARWKQVIARMQPGRLRLALDHKTKAPRSAVVCFECETLLSHGAAQAVAEAAGKFRARLTELAAVLGTPVPVYVLFTKLDRIAFFDQYAARLEQDEANQVLGVTLPAMFDRQGSYSESESLRLGAAFSQLVASLAERRPEFLTRESDPASLPAIYEFPREFKKLRSALVQFLVELCRPNQLTVTPYLRGFYFCGVRPTVITEELAAGDVDTAAAKAHVADMNIDATRMFHAGSRDSGGRAAVAPVPGVISRRVPQWTFLGQFFSGVLLQDEAARFATGSNVHASSLQRILLASATALCIIFAMLLTTSFIANRSLITRVRNSAQSVRITATPGALPTRETLSQLDSLRGTVADLSAWERGSAPWHMTWGLYRGSELYPAAYRTYFERFRAILFGEVERGLRQRLVHLAGAAGPKDDFSSTYNALKAYLETTSHREKATRDFLPAFLYEFWKSGRAIDAERARLARAQFDFYTSELTRVDSPNPYASEPDADAVANARSYLGQFGGVARVYQNMLNEVNRTARPLIFNEAFPGSAEIVLNSREMQGAFTKTGFTLMQNAINDPGKYVSGEEWVLGKSATEATNTATLQRDVRSRYYSDYIAQWRDYLRRSSVVRYKDLADAAARLTLSSKSNSPLLALFWTAADHTAVEAPEVANAFKPLQRLMAGASGEQYVSPANTVWVNGLSALSGTVTEAVRLPSDQAETGAQKVSTSGASALQATRTVELTLGIDPESHIEEIIGKLLEEPILNLSTIPVPGADPAPLNAAGAKFCSEMRAGLLSKYPFQPSPSVKSFGDLREATVADLNAVFRPEKGSLWTFYDQHLKKLLRKDENTWTAIAGARPELTQRFLRFFRDAAAFSEAMYPNGSQDPKLTFALKPLYVPELRNVTLSIDGQSIEIPAGSAPRQITWPNGGVSMTANSVYNFGTYDGLWGLFKFFADANKQGPAPEWMLMAGRSNRPSTFKGTDQPVTVRFEVDMLGKPQIFQKDYFRSLGCVSEVAGH